MARVMLLVGTRKGCFVLESDAERRDWSVRGPSCEGWPVYHAVHDPDSGVLYAAAASEWHGAGVWWSNDLGETWDLSSEGLTYGDDNGGLKLSKVSTLSAAHGRLRAGAESAGAFESTDGGVTWSLLSTLDGQPGRGDWNDPSKQPPGHLGLSAILPHPDEAARFWAIVQGYGLFETTDAGESWTPRNRGLRADWPLGDPEIGYCVHKLVLSPDLDRMYQQNHCGMHRSDDGGHSWVEITEGLPSDFGFAAAAHPHDRDTFYVIPLDPGHARCMHDGRAAVWRTRDAGSTWQRLAQGLPQEDAHLGVLREGMAIDALDVPGLYFGTSTGQVFASADEGESWSEVASYLPAISSVEVAVLN
jgi:BNR/Asp-box repeat